MTSGAAVFPSRLRRIGRLIEVAQRLLGETDIPYPALEFSRIRETLILLAVPDLYVVDGNGEDAAGARDQRDRADIGTERMQQLLSHPAGAQHPVALRAVVDRNRGFVTHDFLAVSKRADCKQIAD